MFGTAERSMGDHEPGQRLQRGAGSGAAFGQTHTSFQFIVVNAVVPYNLWMKDNNLDINCKTATI